MVQTSVYFLSLKPSLFQCSCSQKFPRALPVLNTLHQGNLETGVTVTAAKGAEAQSTECLNYKP